MITGKSGENVDLFPVISRNPFRGTRSEEFLVTHSEEILVTLSKEFLVTNSSLQNLFLGISLELFPRFSQEFLRNILKYSLSITIFLSQNVIVVFDLTEVVMYFVYSDK